MNLRSTDNLEKILKDEALIEKLSRIQSLDEIKSQLESYGVNITYKEIEDAFELKKEIKSLKLDDSELEEIAGGLNLPKKLSAGALSLILGLSGLGMSSKSFAAGGTFESLRNVMGGNGVLDGKINESANKLTTLLSHGNSADKKSGEMIADLIKNLEDSNSVSKRLLIVKLEQLLMSHGIEYLEISEKIKLALQGLASDKMSEEEKEALIGSLEGFMVQP